jgi:hypothetical protein
MTDAGVVFEQNLVFLISSGHVEKTRFQKPTAAQTQALTKKHIK